MQELFLDCNAHLPMSKLSLDAFCKFQESSESYGNPLAPNLQGRKSSFILEECRDKILSLLNAHSNSKLIFTHNTTHAIEWAMMLFKEAIVLEHGPPAYMSPMEHSAIISAFNNNFSSHLLEIDLQGNVLDTINKNIACIHVQNETGLIQPIESIKRKLLLCDLTQSIGKVPVDLQKLDCDFAVFGSHKFGGPGNLGFLYIKDPNNWRTYGSGTRYYFDRPGTMDVASVVAATVALQDCINTYDLRLNKMLEFRHELETYLTELNIEIVFKDSNRCPSTTLFKSPIDPFLLLTQLEQDNIYVGMGSACGSINGTSNLLKQLYGYDSGFIRVSQFGQYGKDDADKLNMALEKIIK